MKENNNDRTWELITKHLGNELNKEDEIEFDAWLQENPENRKELNHAQEIWQLSSQKEIRLFNTNKGWEKLDKRISRTSGSRPMTQRQLFLTISKIAASLLILMALAITADYFIKNANYSKVVAEVKMTAKPVILSDGTKVYLNEGASLIFPKKFGKTTRTVELSGEAFFEVARNEQKPFIIKTKQAQIKVLGTSFNVFADKTADSIQVVVETGLVELKSQLSEEKILISKGNTGSLNTTINKFQLSSSDVNSLAWMTNRIQFHESELLYVTQTLERLFKEKIIIQNENLKQCRVNADFKNQDLKTILDAIKESLNIEIKNTKKGYVLAGPGC